MSGRPHDNETDPVYLSLPLSVQRRIDRAFHRVTSSASSSSSSSPRPSKRRKVQQNDADYSSVGGFLIDDAPGGFVVEDNAAGGGFLVDDTTGGGFLLDESNSPPHSSSPIPTNTKPTQIPLRLVPSALELLSLPPDDPQVLSVFRNAASGWEDAGGARRAEDDDEDDARVVSLKDWRAVCAVLLEGEAGSDEDEVDMDTAVAVGAKSERDDGAGPATRTRRKTGASAPKNAHSYEEEDSPPSDGEYREGSESPLTEEEDEEYTSATARRRSVKASGGVNRRTAGDSDEDEDDVRTLSARQKAECRKVFAMFLDIDGDGGKEKKTLESRRIMIRDVDRVAKLLKEKITADEVVEMLHAFSSSSDRSMSLGDFERMMVATRLV